MPPRASSRLSASRPTRRASRGFTLLEMIAVLAVLGVLIVFAAPSYEGARLRARVKGVSTGIFTDLQYARSEAVQRNAQVSVSFTTGTAWCYGVHQGAAACDCAVAGSCSIKVVSAAQLPGVSLDTADFVSAAGTNPWYLVDPRRGQIVDAVGSPVNGTVTFSDASTGAYSMTAEVNAVGRVRLCSGTIAGYPAC